MAEVSTKRITDDEVKWILQRQEGHYVEFKSIEIAPAKLSQTMSAFANADGGELFIGIEHDATKDNFRWRGFKRVEDANGHLQAFEKLFPLGNDITFSFLTNDRSSGYVLYYEIFKTADVKKASNDTAYLRRGPQNLPQATVDELRRLEYNKGIHSFEDELLNDDVANVTNSTIVIKFMINVVPNAEPIDWLRKQRLIRNNKPSVSAELLFAEEPQAVLPKSSVKIYRYKTTEQGSRDTLAFDPITIDGPTYDQIAAAVDKTIEITEAIPALGKLGLERIRYPREAIHEVITNAVLHRDYSLQDDVHVRIFDNRIEVESPGTLPAHITEENILFERFARNPTLVRLINKFPNPPNKDVGEGLNTAFEAMRKLELKEPQVQQRPNSVVVYLRHERLAAPEEIIMGYLQEHGHINNSKAREICFIGSENKVKRIFQGMMERDTIETIPGKKGKSTAYRLRETN